MKYNSNKNLSWKNKTRGIYETFWRWFYPLPQLYTIIVLHFWIMFCTVPVTTQWNIFTYHSFPVSTMEVIASLIFIKNFLCAKSDTLFISTSLPLYHSLIQRRFAFPLKIPPSLFFIYLFIIITVVITIAYYYYYFYYQYRCYFYHHCY